MDKKKRTNEWGRHRVQILWAFLTNSYLVGFAKGKIYQGKLKKSLCSGTELLFLSGGSGSLSHRGNAGSGGKLEF